MEETNIYKVPEVAEILRVNPKTVYEEIAQGHLKCIRLGRVIRIPKSYLESFINQK